MSYSHHTVWKMSKTFPVKNAFEISREQPFLNEHEKPVEWNDDALQGRKHGASCIQLYTIWL